MAHNTVIPYDTGKVKIGEFYVPPRRVVDMGVHAEMLQRALLTKPTLGERLWHRVTRMFHA
jgi:hypothetical protein